MCNYSLALGSFGAGLMGLFFLFVFSKYCRNQAGRGVSHVFIVSFVGALFSTPIAIVAFQSVAKKRFS